MPIFKIYEGDTRPALRYRFPAGISLTGATVVVSIGSAVVRQPAEILNDREVQLEWRPSIPMEPGLYPLEFEVLYPDGGVESVTDEGTLGVLVQRRMASREP